MDAIDQYLMSAGIDPTNLSRNEKIRYVKDLQRQVLKPRVSADPISKAAVNIDQSPEVVPGSETKERDEPMVDQPPVSSLSDFTQIYDAIAAPLDVKSTPINTPQALKDYQQRIQDKKDAPIEGLQAIDIPIKSAEEKQNEREVSALGDLAIAISGAKNLGELGVGLGRASKGVQAIKDKQEEQILDARLKQRELQRQDIEFTRAQEKEITESLGTLAGIELEMDKAQRDADDKAETRAFERKKATLDALSNTVKLEIYERSILATNDANARKQETALVNYYKAKQAELELADADRRKVIQEELKELDKIIQAALVNKPIDASALGNTGANEVGMTEFFSE
jgi:Sec-independent protein translocase protein TatA